MAIKTEPTPSPQRSYSSPIHSAVVIDVETLGTQNPPGRQPEVASDPRINVEGTKDATQNCVKSEKKCAGEVHEPHPETSCGPVNLPSSPSPRDCQTLTPRNSPAGPGEAAVYGDPANDTQPLKQSPLGALSDPKHASDPALSSPRRSLTAWIRDGVQFGMKRIASVGKAQPVNRAPVSRECCHEGHKEKSQIPSTSPGPRPSSRTDPDKYNYNFHGDRFRRLMDSIRSTRQLTIGGYDTYKSEDASSSHSSDESTLNFTPRAQKIQTLHRNSSATTTEIYATPLSRSDDVTPHDSEQTPARRYPKHPGRFSILSNKSDILITPRLSYSSLNARSRSLGTGTCRPHTRGIIKTT